MQGADRMVVQNFRKLNGPNAGASPMYQQQEQLQSMFNQGGAQAEMAKKIKGNQMRGAALRQAEWEGQVAGARANAMRQAMGEGGGGGGGGGGRISGDRSILSHRLNSGGLGEQRGLRLPKFALGGEVPPNTPAVVGDSLDGRPNEEIVMSESPITVIPKGPKGLVPGVSAGSSVMGPGGPEEKQYTASPRNYDVPTMAKFYQSAGVDMGTHGGGREFGRGNPTTYRAPQWLESAMKGSTGSEKKAARKAWAAGLGEQMQGAGIRMADAAREVIGSFEAQQDYRKHMGLAPLPDEMEKKFYDSNLEKQMAMNSSLGMLTNQELRKKDEAERRKYGIEDKQEERAYATQKEIEQEKRRDTRQRKEDQRRGVSQVTLVPDDAGKGFVPVVKRKDNTMDMAGPWYQNNKEEVPQEYTQAQLDEMRARGAQLTQYSDGRWTVTWPAQKQSSSTTSGYTPKTSSSASSGMKKFE